MCSRDEEGGTPAAMGGGRVSNKISRRGSRINTE